MARKTRESDKDEGFLSRWSARKRGGGEEEDAPQTAPAVQPEAGTEAEWGEQEIESKLAEIEKMKPGDDFKPLLAATVPEVVKRAALRKLWRSNPVFGILDGLNDYDLDYTFKPGLVGQIRSAYQAGKGYVYDEEMETERQAEIAARRERDKQRQQAQAEADEAAGRDDESNAPTENAAQTPSVAVDTHDRSETAPERPRGKAAARRWGGGSA